MAKYSSIHHRVSLFGTLRSSPEIWSTGFALAQTNGGDEGTAPTVAEAQAVAEAFKSFWLNANTNVSDKYELLGAKISHVNTAGQSDAALTRYYHFPVPVRSTFIGVAMPPQVSIVATLQTLKVRGAGSKGRMYLPGISAGIDVGGKLAPNFVTGIANQMKIFLDTVNASVDVPGVVTLMSAESPGVPFRAAEQNIVASVRVGDVYDTQRRRRNALIEAYQSAALA